MLRTTPIYVLLALSCLAACARSAEAPADVQAIVGVAPDAGLPASASDAGMAMARDDASAGAALEAGPPPLSDAGGSAPAPGDASAPEPDAAPARDAAASSECKAGVYKGAFAGTVQFLPTPLGALLEVNIQGSLEITVEAATQGDVLVAKNGKVHGSDQDGNPVDADLTGSLDCATKKLQNGKLVNGKYVRGGILTTSFSGTVEGTYVADPPAASGTWKTSAGFLEGGGGTWSAALVP